MTSDLAGKLFRIAAAAATVGLAACVHAAAETVPLGQIMAMRAGISMLLILAYGLATVPARTLLPRRWRPHLARGALACVAMTLTYIAFARLPVTQAQTLIYLAPVLVVPFAIWRLGERFRVSTAIALALGCSGVALILGLTFEAGRYAFVGAVAGLGAAILIAVIQVAIRAMTATESTLSIALSFTVIVLGVMSFTALAGNWVLPQGVALWALVGAGVFGALNLVCLAEALARAPAATLAPLDYTGLVWALLADWLLFSQVPGPLGVLGSILITAAALVVVLRRARPVVVPPAAP
ncbi:DMT family transporter [Roseibacterium sp. SDUM158016]|uniref:DMT family transporter n=1 Tax=Roseicyclus sediminis TaxID=2980997 RepID=UPI0021D10CF4|nr:DMT family transporter [Roseibacterium sp. SDUM158016]MCU4651654.1 DMT family transporter [Roseibacterium sp. SDUM158016]